MTTTSNTEFFYLKNIEDLAFGQRIARVIEARGISKAWVAERLGISKQALNYLLKHSIKPKFVDEFAELLELDPKWIETGIGVPVITAGETEDFITTKLPITTQKTLLVQEKHSEKSQETIDFSHHQAETFIAYRLEDDSNFPPFIEGSILIFNDKKRPNNEDYVLCTIGNDVFVRQYLIDGDNICYKASNNQHKTFINPQAVILGVLTEVRYRLN